MARYLYNTRCPNCAKLGKDTAGDNMGVYDDGGTWCFQCGYWESGTGYSNVEERPAGYPLILERKIPEENMIYLRQYLSDDEIELYFRWCPSLQRHVFYHRKGDDIFWEARSVNGRQPKAIQCGSKPYFPFDNLEDKTNSIVLVEDVVSAIVVSRQTSALPLWGSRAKPGWIQNLIKPNGYSTIYIWLDKDKLADSIALSRNIGLFKPCYVINTEEDPKCYDEEDMQEILSNPGIVHYQENAAAQHQTV